MPRSKKDRSEVAPPRPEPPPAPRPPIDRQGFAVGRDDTPVYYRVFGVADAPAVILCDGIGCDGYIWKYLGRELAAQYRVVHWHYRGHGRTPPPRDSRRVRIEDLADDLAGVIDAAVADGAPATLLGHSMGVQVCLEAYRRHRERVLGLGLICGSHGTPLRTFKGQETLEQVLPLVMFAVNRVPGVVANVWRNVLPTELAFQIAKKFEINGALIRREDFFPYLEHMAQVDVRLFLQMLAEAARHSARDLLERIDVPTLIVAGDRDGFTPPSLSEEMHRLIPGAELLVVEHGSHTAPIERPGEVNRRVCEFLRTRLG